MNILPKKSWHVRSRDNIAKVKRDEARAAEEEKEKEARIALAEQEARTEKLREKARNKHADSTPYGHHDEEVIGPMPVSDAATAQSSQPRTHINFFSEIESGSNTKTNNKDHEAEKKQEQEAYEKKIGLLVGLGQSAIESQITKPWYQQNRGERDKKVTQTTDTDTNEMKRKAAMDPMNDMMRYLGKKPKSVTETKTSNQGSHSKEKEAQSKGGLPGTTSLMSMFTKYKKKCEEVGKSKDKSHHRKHKEKKKKHHKLKVKESRKDSHKRNHKNSSRKRRKHSRHSSDSSSVDVEDARQEARLARRQKKSHKRHKKRRRKSSESDSDIQSSSSINSEVDNKRSSASAKPSPTIEQLRAERMRREAAEKTKTARFLAGKSLVEPSAPEVVITDKLDGKYNSQFNPHLARKHLPKEPLF